MTLETIHFASCSRLQRLRLGLRRCTCVKRYILGIVCPCNSFDGVFSVLFFFFVWDSFVLLDILIFIVVNSQVINRYDPDIFPSKTSETISKKSVSPSRERIIAFVFLLKILSYKQFFEKTVCKHFLFLL